MADFLANEVKETDLLFVENTSDFLDLDSITTATVYQGSPPIAQLKSRVNAIAEMNPWIVGRLVRKKKKLVLRYPLGRVCDIDLVVTDEYKTNSYNPVRDNPKFEKYFIEKGSACINNDKSLFRIILAVLNPHQFVMFVSLSHAVADGSTYYSIYNMLCANALPRSLIVERDESFSLIIRAVNREERKVFRTVAFLMNVIGKVLWHGKHHVTYCTVNPEWIELEKDTYLQRKVSGGNEEKDGDASCMLPEDDWDGPDIPYISANDILTSTVLKALNADLGVMPVNFRNRIDGLSPNHCGNYEGIIGYCKNDYQRPEDIRASITWRGKGKPSALIIPDVVRQSRSPNWTDKNISTLAKSTISHIRGQYKRVNLSRPILPSFSSKRKATVGFVTNWAGFYEQIDVEGCEHISHFPVFSSTMPALIPGAVIYKSSRDTLNIMALQGKPIFVDNLVKVGAVSVCNASVS